MKYITICEICLSRDIDYLGNDECYCHHCGQRRPSRDKYIQSPIERTRDVVFATGNRWAVENFQSTHTM